MKLLTAAATATAVASALAVNAALKHGEAKLSRVRQASEGGLYMESVPREARPGEARADRIVERARAAAIESARWIKTSAADIARRVRPAKPRKPVSPALPRGGPRRSS